MEALKTALVQLTDLCVVTAALCVVVKCGGGFERPDEDHCPHWRGKGYPRTKCRAWWSGPAQTPVPW